MACSNGAVTTRSASGAPGSACSTGRRIWAILAACELLLLKPRAIVDQYADLVSRLQPRNVMELGLYDGGSTALVSLLGRQLLRRPRAQAARPSVSA
jgi:hypothetical protein